MNMWLPALHVSHTVTL